jgi:hypothetical protein
LMISPTPGLAQCEKAGSDKAGSLRSTLLANLWSLLGTRRPAFR